MLSTLAELLSALDQADVDPRVADALASLRHSYATAATPAAALPYSNPERDGVGAASSTADMEALQLLLGEAVRERALPADGEYAPSSDADRLIEASAAVAARREVVALLDRALRLAFQCGLRVAAATPAGDGAVVDAAPPVRAQYRHDRLRAFARVFELLAEGVLLVDDAGRPVYLNPALSGALRAEAEREHVLRRMRQLAHDIPRGSAGGPPPVATCEVRTLSDRYQLRATRLGDEVTGLERMVAVTLQRTTALLPSAAMLAQRFGLTAAEASVARLLAQGYSNDALARKLGISPHTARHHTESVLLKLDVHSRAEVGPKVLGTRRTSAPVRVIREEAPPRKA